MSTDWDIICDTCKERHGFDDAARREDLMLVLCKFADVIASLDELDHAFHGDMEIVLGNRWPVRVSWFRKHFGHELVPINEYGDRLDSCRKRQPLVCAAGHTHPCGLKHGHEGECRLTYESRRF